MLMATMPLQRGGKKEHPILSTELKRSFQIKLLPFIIHGITLIYIQQIQKPSTSLGSSKDNWNLGPSTLAIRRDRDRCSNDAQMRPTLPHSYEAAAVSHMIRKPRTRHRKNLNASVALAKRFCMPLTSIIKGFYKVLVNTPAGINKIMPKAPSCID